MFSLNSRLENEKALQGSSPICQMWQMLGQAWLIDLVTQRSCAFTNRNYSETIKWICVFRFVSSDNGLEIGCYCPPSWEIIDRSDAPSQASINILLDQLIRNFCSQFWFMMKFLYVCINELSKLKARHGKCFMGDVGASVFWLIPHLWETRIYYQPSAV